MSNPEIRGEVLRTLRHLLAETDRERLPAVMLESGLRELLSEDYRSTMQLWFQAHSETSALGPSLDLVVLDALGMPLETDAAVLHPAFEAHDRLAVPIEKLSGLLVVNGILMPGFERSDNIAVVATGEGGEDLAVLVSRRAFGCEVVSTVDPSTQLSTVSGNIDLLERASAGAVQKLRPGSGRRAVAAVQIALAHELVGLAGSTLELAVSHVQNREQFGHPLAAKQAVKHRLADVFVAIEAARGLLGAPYPEADPMIGWSSKAVAGRAARAALDQAQQVCGAIGYTAEHPLTALADRSILLDGLYGSTPWLERSLGRAVLLAERVPRLVDL